MKTVLEVREERQTRFYPTDLLLALGGAQESLKDPASELSRHLRRFSLSGLSPLFAAAPLADGLDELFSGLNQYPWQHVIDSDDVYELTPVGTVLLDDDKAGNTLRGLIMSWATGNRVCIRTDLPEFWLGLEDILRLGGAMLPPCRVTETGAQGARGTVIRVPDMVVEPPQDAAWSLWLRESPVYSARRTSAAAPAVSLAPAWLARHRPEELESVLLTDCRAGWARQLFHRKRLVGVRLADIRSADSELNGRGRLDAKLRYLVHRAKSVPFYRELETIGGVSELGRLPILDKAALELNSLPSSRAMSSNAAPNGEVLRTGASSGAARYIVYSRSDWMNMVREAIPMFYAMGLSKGDRLINALHGGNLYGGMLTSNSELSRMPVECYTTGQFLTADDLLMLTERFGANVVLGMPALLLPVLRDAKARKPELTMEKVIYGGTPMAETDKDWLRQNLGTRVISSILASNDGAQLGYQCSALGGTLHHLCEDYNLIEAVDDEGRPVAEGVAGHLLITSLQKHEGPLIRYRIGDFGRIFRRECACGVSGLVLDYQGRSDGLIRVKAMNIHYGDVLRALGEFKVSQLQIEVASRGNKELFIVRTESPSALEAGKVRAFLMKEFKALGDISKFDAKLDVFEFSVECRAEGELDRNPVSGKIKPVIDRRLEKK